MIFENSLAAMPYVTPLNNLLQNGDENKI